MSRSRNDPKHGKVPHGTGHKQRATGYEFWGKRPGGPKHGCQPGKVTKRATHRAERRAWKKDVRDE